MRALKVFLFAAIFLGAAAFYLFHVTVPDVSILKTHYPAVRYLSKEKAAEVTLQPARPKSWVSIKSVSKGVLGAIIVSEDWAFFQHDGYDANQLQLVLQEVWEKKKLGRGASTITQQVVKNVFLSNERSVVRKVLEFYLSIQLDEILNKYRILEIYINIAEMGPGIYGIGPASYYYFKKGPGELNAKEGAFLAMLLPSPVRYGQSFRERKLSYFARHSIESILDKMVRANYLTESERYELRSYNLSFEQMPEAGAEPAADADEEFIESEEKSGETNPGVDSPLESEDAADSPPPPAASEP